MELTEQELEICHKLILYIRKDKHGQVVINWTDNLVELEPQIKIKCPLDRTKST